MSCEKSQKINKLARASFNYQLDNSALASNPLVRAIRADSDSLRDNLTGVSGGSFYLDKANIFYPELGGQAWFQEQVKAWNINAPLKKHYKDVFHLKQSEIDKIFFFKTPHIDFLDPKIVSSYRGAMQEIASFFKDPVEFEEYFNSLVKTYQSVQAHWVNLNFLYRFSISQKKQFAKNIIASIENSEVIGLSKYLQNRNISFEGTTHLDKLKEARNILIESILRAGNINTDHRGWRKASEKLIDDMLYLSKEHQPVWYSIGNSLRFLRSIAIPLKYTIWVASGAKLLIQNSLLGSLSLFARSKGIQKMADSNVANILQDEFNILKSESRFNPNQEFWEGIIDKVSNLFMKNSKELNKIQYGIKGTARILQWGIHNIWDMASDSLAKRQSILEALSEYGITGDNVEEFISKLRNGEVPETILQQIRTSAHEKYSRFYGSSQVQSRTTHLLSADKYMPISFMQGYTIKKMGQVVASITNLSQEIKLWRIKSLQDIIRYIDSPEWAILKEVMMTTIFTAKVANWITHRMYEEMDEKEKKERVYQYMFALNDYLSSTEANIIGRLFSSFASGFNTEYYIEDENGNMVTSKGGIDGGIFKTLDTLSRSILRETQLFNIAPVLVNSINPEVGFELSHEMLMKEFNKVIKGMGRYSLDSWEEPYDNKPIEERYDDIHSLLLVKSNINKSMQIAEKIFDKSTMQNYKDGNKVLSYADLIKKMNIIMPFINSVSFDTFKKEYSKEGRYDFIKTITEKDSLALDLYNGRYNENILVGSEKAKLWKGTYNIDYIYNNLISFDNWQDSNNEYSVDKTQKTGKDWELDSFGIDYGTFQVMLKKAEEVLGKERLYELLDNADKNNIQKSTTIFEDWYNININKERAKRYLKDENGKYIKDSKGRWIEDDSPVLRNDLSTRDRGRALEYGIIESKIPGGGRLLNALLASNYAYKITKEIYWKDATLSTISPEQKERVQREVINRYAQGMIDTDIDMRYMLFNERLKQVSPAMYTNTGDYKSIVNSMGLQKMAIYNQIKQGNYDARKLANNLSILGKWVNNNKARLAIIKDIHYEIDQLDIPVGDKQIIHTANMLGNIDFINELKNDKEFYKKYSPEFDDVLNLLYNTVETNTNVPNENSIEEDSNGEKKKYSPRYLPRKNRSNWGKSKNFARKGFPDKESSEEPSYNASSNEDAVKELAKKIKDSPHPTERKHSINATPNALSRRNTHSPTGKLYIHTVMEKMKEGDTEDLTKVKNPVGRPKAKIQKSKNSYKAKRYKEVPVVLPKIKDRKYVKYWNR